MAAIWPSIEDSMDELMESYPAEPQGGVQHPRRSTSVEAYIDAEMLSLIVPLALAFLAVRAIVARAISGAEERGYLDIAARGAASRGARSSPARSSSRRSWSRRCSPSSRAMTWLAGTARREPIRRSLVLGRGMGERVAAGDVLRRAAPSLAAGRAAQRRRRSPAIAAGHARRHVRDRPRRQARRRRSSRCASLSAFKYYGSAIQDGIDPLAFAGLDARRGALLAAAGAFLFERRDVR